MELARYIDVFGQEFALTMPLLEAPLQSAWDGLPVDQQTLLRAVATAPASVSVGGLAAIAHATDVKALREACWFLRNGDRFDLTAPARSFVRRKLTQTPWALLSWIGELGRKLFVQAATARTDHVPHPDDIALLAHAAQIDDSEQATWALLGAADVLRSSDHHAAEQLLTRHLAFKRDAEMRSALYTQRSNVYRVLTLNEQAGSDARQALSLATSDHHRMRAHAAVGYAEFLRPKQALTHLGEAIEIARRHGAKARENAYLAATGACYRNLGDLKASQHSLERALAVAQDAQQRVRVRSRLAMTLADRGDLASAMRQISMVIDDARSENMLMYTAIGYANLGFIQLLAGADPTLALSDADEICRRIGYRTGHGIVISTQALYAVVSERYEEAERQFYLSLDLLAPSPVRGVVQAWLARLEVALGRPSQSFKECLRLCESDEERTMAVKVLMGAKSGTWPQTSLVRLAEQFNSTCRRLEATRRAP
jgi:tetratricopeptide (TPR) repeat protein